MSTTKPTSEETKPESKPEEGEVLSLREQKLKEMQDPSSAIRNQATVQDIVDHQLLTNAPAQTIAAMTDWSMERLKKRADQLETTLKGSLAGDFRPAAQ